MKVSSEGKNGSVTMPWWCWGIVVASVPTLIGGTITATSWAATTLTSHETSIQLHDNTIRRHDRQLEKIDEKIDKILEALGNK